jgi:hypothetical protein
MDRYTSLPTVSRCMSCAKGMAPRSSDVVVVGRLEGKGEGTTGAMDEGSGGGIERGGCLFRCILGF